MPETPTVESPPVTYQESVEQVITQGKRTVEWRKVPAEWRLIALRDCAPFSMALVTDPVEAAKYWRESVVQNPYLNPEVENFVVLVLNTRRRVNGHWVVSTGTLDTILVHPREVFRTAIVANAAAIILMHNHPSGDATPSEADIRVTRDLIRAGQLLKIDVLDHVIIGHGCHTSLRELGYFLV